MKIPVLFSAFIVFSIHGLGQEIRNVKATQVDKKIIINYDIIGANKQQKFEVKLLHSLNGGFTWSSRLKDVSGDVGSNITGGYKKKIIWNVFGDRTELVGSNIVFRVKARIKHEAPKSHQRGSYSESIKIQGLITDDNGKPLIGASIATGDNSIQTVTDINGKYTLDVPHNYSYLIIKHPSHETKKVSIKENHSKELKLRGFSPITTQNKKSLPITLALSGGKVIPFGFGFRLGSQLQFHSDLRTNFKQKHSASTSLYWSKYSVLNYLKPNFSFKKIEFRNNK